MEKFKLVAKIVSSMEKVFPEREPANEEYASTMFKNERLNFQIAIYNLEEYTIKRNKIVVKGAWKDFVRVREVKLMPAECLPAKGADDYYLKREPGLYPDLLRPFGVFGVCVPSGQWRAFWVSVDLPETVEAGNYEIGFDIVDEFDNIAAELSYNVEVLDAVLPPHGIRVTSWMHYDCISNYHGVPVFSDEYYEIFDKYLAAYLDCGYNMLLVPLFTPPLDTGVGLERKTAQLVDVFLKDGEYSFDFSKLHKFLDFALARGVEQFEFSHLFTQWGGEHCPKIMANVDGEEKRIFGWESDSLGDEYKKFLTALLPKIVEIVKARGLEKRVVFHLTDEPHKKHLEQYKGCYALVKGLIGDLPTMDALSDYEFFETGAVDIPVPVTNAVGAFIDRKKEDLHVYYCCGPTHAYFSNRLFNMPSQRMRIIGTQLYANDVVGFLHWGFNFYNTQYSYAAIDPYFDTCAGGVFPAGDSFLVYPDRENKGVQYSLRAETHKEALQDFRALKLLESHYGKEFTKNLLKEEGVEGFMQYPRSATWHTRFRQKVNALIKEKL